MTWDDRLQFNATAPTSEGLARMAHDVIGRRSHVDRVQRLRGGLDASTHAVRLDPGGWVVLKRSSTTDPRALAGEFERLGFAQSARVTTPTPIALDAEGVWFGRPALVMSKLPGRSVFRRDRGPWIIELATALAAIHDTALPAVLPDVLRAPHAGIVWKPGGPMKTLRSPRGDALLSAARDLQDRLRVRTEPGVFLHHDFHHGNVLWRGGRLAAVLDWNEARAGPAACDVAYCSVDLAMTHGARAAQSFCDAYDSASGRRLDELCSWQALWILNAMRWVGYWIASFREAHVDHLTLPALRRHLRSFADRVLTEL